MFALRRVRAPTTVNAFLRRGNATLQQQQQQPGAETDAGVLLTPKPEKSLASKSTPAPNKAKADTTATPETEEEDKAATQGRRRRKTILRPARTPISTAAPRKWNRPLAEGVLPAYDLALKVIRTDSIRLTEEADALEVHISEAEKGVLEGGGYGAEAVREKEAELEQMREKLHILRVQSEVNLPEVRWRVANAMVDMKKPVHRHLMEQKWRKDGALDLLMERIHQMKVVPDVLPELHPSFDLIVTARTPALEFRKTGKSQTGIEPGSFLLPEQTATPPKLYANIFHSDTRLYTLLMVDPDVVNEEKESFNTFLHWMQPNIPLSATHTTRILDLNSHTPYIPPHPQRGTPYHRYVLLLLPQPPLAGSTYTHNAEARAELGKSTSVHLEIPPVSDVERRDFDVRMFTRRWGLDATKGGGAHMWREVWSEGVSKIYAEVLKEDEPRYGRPPKADPYAALKRTKRYV
ncbi:phosphatidylethanolamine-binding protein [Collybia nuda]|uniref:Phosphatidylethanolamine-binding protein n=1 Tax=Collybia nuda TaxID=64659 RepID=A0A9P5XTR1_9AGAR|nr:phosphatidylethanolamine-binding protein [Collybia nuda]